MRSRGRGPRDGIKGPYKKRKGLEPPLSAMRGHSKRAAVCKPGGSPHQKPKHQHLAGLRFPTPGTVRNTCLSAAYTTQSMAFCYSSRADILPVPQFPCMFTSQRRGTPEVRCGTRSLPSSVSSSVIVRNSVCVTGSVCVGRRN